MSGRIRTIKPEWLEDGKLVMASSDARVLSIALILLADDYGNGRIVEEVLGARVFPRAPKVLAASLRELISMHFLTVYVVEDQTYYHIRTWEKHQRIDNAGKARVPSHLDPLAEIRGEIPQVAEIRGLTPTPTKTPNRPPEDRCRGVIDLHRQLMQTIRGVDVASTASKPTNTAAKKIATLWPDTWKQILEAFVRVDDEWLEARHWPIAVLAKYPDRYETIWRNTGRTAKPAETTSERIKREEAERKALEAKRIAEIEAERDRELGAA